MLIINEIFQNLRNIARSREFIELDNLMGRYFAGKVALAVGLGFSALALSGCIGGTTFGTGVSQERQLVNDLEGMMTMGGKKKRKTRIDYSARPDLVMPAKTAALPEPLEEEASSSNVDWPENPEQRLARIRASAEEADVRSGEISVEELQREKPGIGVRSSKIRKPDMDRDGHAAIDALSEGTHKKPEMLKEKYAYSTKPTRKYLTEPTIDLVTPVDSAPAGDLGVSEAEKEKRAEKAAKIKKQTDEGMWVD
jgi:hypothetical protein